MPSKPKPPRGKLKGVTLKRVKSLLSKYDFNIPGHSKYKHKVTARPDILKQDPLPYTCTRAECEEAIHFYNFKKHAIYRGIIDGNSYSSISRRIRIANKIRWQIVLINSGIVHKYLEKHTNLLDYLEPVLFHMHQTVDRFNPKLGFAPSTYFYSAMKRHVWKLQNGNANAKNMNYVYASEMGRYYDEDFQAIFDSKTTDLDFNPVSDEVEHIENRERIAVLMDGIEDDRDRKVISLRFFSCLLYTSPSPRD